MRTLDRLIELWEVYAWRKSSDCLALRLHAVRTGMDDANYLKPVDQVNVNICRSSVQTQKNLPYPAFFFVQVTDGLESLL